MSNFPGGLVGALVVAFVAVVVYVVLFHGALTY